MLYNHNPNVVPGRWSDITVENQKLIATPEFDMDDEDSKKLAGKVERGFIKGASITFTPLEVRNDIPGFDGPVVTQCILIECSVCPLPSNGSALRVLTASGELLSDDSAIRNYISLSAQQQTQPKIDMKNLPLIVAALQLAAGSTEEQVIEAINKNLQKITELTNKNTELENKVSELKTQLSNESKLRVDALVDGAIASNKLTAAERETWHKLATADFDSTKKALDSRPVHTPVVTQLNNPANSAEAAFENKTFLELKKYPEGVAYLERLSRSNADLYNKKKATPGAVVTA